MFVHNKALGRALAGVLALGTLAAGFTLSPAAAQRGTKVQLALTDEQVGTKFTRKGDEIHLQLVAPIQLANGTVVPASTSAIAVCTESRLILVKA